MGVARSYPVESGITGLSPAGKTPGLEPAIRNQITRLRIDARKRQNERDNRKFRFHYIRSHIAARPEKPRVQTQTNDRGVFASLQIRIRGLAAKPDPRCQMMRLTMGKQAAIS